MANAAARPLQLRLLSLAHRVLHRVTGGRIGSLETGTHAPKGRALRFITRLHRRLYKLTGGFIGGDAGGLTTLLLTTTGRKSGEARTVPLPYFEHAGRYLLVASNAGNEKHPAWYLNLVANPDVTLQIRTRTLRARAATADAKERAELWPLVTAQGPMYADYQRVVAREIPLVILTPT